MSSTSVLRQFRDEFYLMLINRSAFLSYVALLKPFGLFSEDYVRNKVHENIANVLRMELHTLLNQVSQKDVIEIMSEWSKGVISRNKKKKAPVKPALIANTPENDTPKMGPGLA